MVVVVLVVLLVVVVLVVVLEVLVVLVVLVVVAAGIGAPAEQTLLRWKHRFRQNSEQTPRLYSEQEKA